MEVPLLLKNEALFILNEVDAAGLVLGDLHEFDTMSLSWTDLTYITSGIPPSSRLGMGMAVFGGKIFVWGGKGANGEALSVPTTMSFHLIIITALET